MTKTLFEVLAQANERFPPNQHAMLIDREILKINPESALAPVLNDNLTRMVAQRLS